MLEQELIIKIEKLKEKGVVEYGQRAATF